MTTETMQANHVTATSGNQQTAVLDLVLQWRDTDPLLVRLIVTPRGGHPIVWDFDRDQLTAGLDAPVGIGDWSMFPDLTRRDGLRVELVLVNARHGIGYNLSMPLLAAPLRRFLDRTYQVVAAGVELDVVVPAELAGGAAA